MKTRTSDRLAPLFNGICLCAAGTAMAVTSLLAECEPFYKVVLVIICILIVIAGALQIRECTGGKEDGR